MKIKEVEKFAKENYSMSTLTRFNTTPRIINQSVACHSYFVSLISLFICEKMKLSDESTLKCLKMSTIHDLAEAELGDIIYPVRVKFEKLNEILDEEERNVIENKLGEQYRDLFDEFEECKTIEAIIVKLSDAMEANIYCKEEVNMGNKNMKKIIKETNQRIKQLWKKLENARK